MLVLPTLKEPYRRSWHGKCSQTNGTKLIESHERTSPQYYYTCEEMVIANTLTYSGQSVHEWIIVPRHEEGKHTTAKRYTTLTTKFDGIEISHVLCQDKVDTLAKMGSDQDLFQELHKLLIQVETKSASRTCMLKLCFLLTNIYVGQLDLSKKSRQKRKRRMEVQATTHNMRKKSWMKLMPGASLSIPCHTRGQGASIGRTCEMHCRHTCQHA